MSENRSEDDIRRWIAMVVAEAPVPATDLSELGLTSNDRRDRGARLAVAVAAAAVVLLLVAVGAKLMPSDNGGRNALAVSSANSPSRFLPVGLPAGWTVEGVTTESIPFSNCPCEYGFWKSDDGLGSVEAHRREDGTASDLQGSAVDLGPDVHAAEAEQGRVVSIAWTFGHETVTMTASGISKEDARAAARTLVGKRFDQVPELGGLRLLDATVFGVAGSGSAAVHTVTLQSPSGKSVFYSVAPAGLVRSLLGDRVVESSLPGQTRPVVEIERSGGLSFEGLWGDSDVVVGSSDDDERADEADMRALVGALSPVDEQAWSSFTDSTLLPAN